MSTIEERRARARKRKASKVGREGSIKKRREDAAKKRLPRQPFTTEHQTQAFRENEIRKTVGRRRAATPENQPTRRSFGQGTAAHDEIVREQLQRAETILHRLQSGKGSLFERLLADHKREQKAKTDEVKSL